ncbi:MAG TPA: helix-turn-helix domain-containing protein [Usitatibacter sp.]|jgi:AcrR family transcriptional regulator|nr:helix-turn-helix domain-containing protein [Usitatibacter sp.]
MERTTVRASAPIAPRGTAAVDTKARILDAAFRRLAREGYAALGVREIAQDAGVNHALINYHFGSKDQLVIAVLDEANRRLLERQEAMYRGAGGLASKWAEARRFYREDLLSGFVRVQAELWAASLSNPELREKFLPRVNAWKRLVGKAVADAAGMLEGCGVHLPPPFTPPVLACWISEFWLGMEFSDLLRAPGERKQHQAALDAMQQLLERVDDLVERRAKAPARPSRKKRGNA